MTVFSAAVTEMSRTSEHFDCLESVIDGLENHERLMSELNRDYSSFMGDENRFTSNLVPQINDVLVKKGYTPSQRYAEFDYHKKALDYVREYCHCEDPKVIERFYEIIGHNNQFPDIIIHKPNEMLHQICFIEVKFEGNSKIWEDFDKLTRFKAACQYLLDYVDIKNINPVFFYHVLIFLCRSLPEKIKNADEKTKSGLRKCDPNIICIYKEDNVFHCQTLGEILDEIKTENKQLT